MERLDSSGGADGSPTRTKRVSSVEVGVSPGSGGRGRAWGLSTTQGSAPEGRWGGHAGRLCSRLPDDGRGHRTTVAGHGLGVGAVTEVVVGDGTAVGCLRHRLGASGCAFASASAGESGTQKAVGFPDGGDFGTAIADGNFRLGVSGTRKAVGNLGRGDSGTTIADGNFWLGESGTRKAVGNRGRGESGTMIADGNFRLGVSGTRKAVGNPGRGESGTTIADGIFHLGVSGTRKAVGNPGRGESGTTIADGNFHLGVSGTGKAVGF